MAYKLRAFGLITRVLGLLLVVLVFGFVVNKQDLYFTSIGLGIVVLGITWNLYSYTIRSQKNLADFLAKLEANDFSQSLAFLKSEDDLKAAFQKINQRFANEITQRLIQFQYLQNIINHIQVAIICFGPDNKTDLINPAALKLLQIHQLSNLAALNARYSSLATYIQGRKSSGSQCLVLEEHDAKPEILLTLSIFKLKGEEFKLVSMLDVSQQLLKRELQSWKNLISVLNHEIVNSVAPILSLSTSNLKALNQQLINTNPDSSLKDLAESLDAIERRSKDLLRMVEDFRSFMATPIPKPEVFCLNQLVVDTITFIKPSTEQLRMQFIPTSTPILVFADKGMIERLLINLLLNSIAAVLHQETKYILIETDVENGMAQLSVKDTGLGIPSDILDKVFIPFFTTKEKGSGIGLSVCRELAHANNGQIAHIQNPDWGCCFMAKFPVFEA